MLIRATKKVLNLAHTKPDSTQLKVNDLNEWYVTTARTAFRGKGLLLFVHSKSLLTVIIEGKSIKRSFSQFKPRLTNLLKRSNFPTALVGKILAETAVIETITTTNNRSILGYLNRIVQQVEARCLMFTRYDDLDFDVEENILLESLYKKKYYFSPISWWNNYIHGEDPYSEAFNMPIELNIIQASKLNKDGLTLEEELHMENQVLKMDLEQKFGKPINLNISGSDLPEIPLQVENEFLKQMSLFERQMREATETTVFQLIGSPRFKATSSLKGERLSIEIIRILKLLFKHHITVDFLAEYEPEVVYDFLTGELMGKTLPNMNVPGFVTHFIYEEFHPNYEHEITALVNNLINYLFNPDIEEDVLLEYLSGEEVVLNQVTVTSEQLLQAVKTFHFTKQSPLVMGFDIKDVILSNNNTQARAVVDIILKNEVKGKRRPRIPFVIDYTKGERWWEVKQLSFEYFIA